MKNWLLFAEIAVIVFLVGLVLFFIFAFTIETLKDSKRHKLWKKAMKMIKKYKEINRLDADNNRLKLKIEIANTWGEYKKLQEENMWKSISKNKVDEIERYLISEKII